MDCIARKTVASANHRERSSDAAHGDLRPSGCSVIGTSATFRTERRDLMIISVANSIPVHRWSEPLDRATS